MPHYLLKAAVQGSLSLMPGAALLNSAFQRHLTKSLGFAQEAFDYKVGLCRKHFESYVTTSSEQRPDFRVIELGTGWYPVIPVGLYLCGATSVLSVDKRRLHNPQTLKATLSRFAESARSGRLHALLPAALNERIQRLIELTASRGDQDPETVLNELGITLVVGDARRVQLPHGSVDFIFSNIVLRDIPPEIIHGIFTEFRRLLSPAGVMSHHISLEDHYADFDRGITPYNFLRFSETTWRMLNNRLHYQNRLRISDYRKIHTDCGFRIVNEENQSGELERLMKLPIHPTFHKYSLGDLTVIRSWLVSIRSDVSVPVQ